MSKFKSQGFLNTFKNARRGFRLVFKSEINIRIHLLIAVFVLLSGWALGFNVVRFCILLIAIALVVVVEILNTSIEFTLDAIFHNKYSKLVGMAKDISAGAVMVSTIISIVIGILLFGEAVINRILLFEPLVFLTGKF